MLLLLDSLLGWEAVVVDGSTLEECVPVFSPVVVVTAAVKFSVVDGDETVKLLLLGFKVLGSLV